MIRLGLCCIFRDKPIKFRNTTATAVGKMKRADALAKLSGICMANAEALLAALRFCANARRSDHRHLPGLVPSLEVLAAW